jgi:hypothetical protein
MPDTKQRTSFSNLLPGVKHRAAPDLPPRGWSYAPAPQVRRGPLLHDFD